MTLTTVPAEVLPAPDVLGASDLARVFLGDQLRPFDPAARDAALSSFRRPSSSQAVLSHSARARHGHGFTDGRTFRLEVGPGVLALSAVDRVRVDRAHERTASSVHTSAELYGKTGFDPYMARRVRHDHDTVDSPGSGFYRGRLLQRVWLGVQPLDPLSRERVPTRSVTEWSAKSRARMVRKFASVDFASIAREGAVLAMVTLTYPKFWERSAPNGAAAKRHLANFRRRWSDDLGYRLDGAWKLEFQGRGAPHFHLLMPVPAMVGQLTFEAWLSAAWASVVGADDSWCHRCTGYTFGASYGPSYACLCEAADTERRRHRAAGTNVDFKKTGRYTDPRRCAVYFLKHGSKTLDDKEYQHLVPNLWQLPGAGPGRFWGFWGMSSEGRTVDLDLLDWLRLRRVARHVMDSRRRGMNYRARRAALLPKGENWSQDQLAAATRAAMTAGYSRSRSFGAGGSLFGGWVMLGDGPGTAAALARWLSGVPETRLQQRRRYASARLSESASEWRARRDRSA